MSAEEKFLDAVSFSGPDNFDEATIQAVVEVLRQHAAEGLEARFQKAVLEFEMFHSRRLRDKKLAAKSRCQDR